MADPIPRSTNPEDEPKAADADWLRADEPEEADSDRAVTPEPAPEGGYDVLGGEPAAEMYPEPIARPAPERAADRPAAPRRAAEGPAPRENNAAAASKAQVDQVWTRGAEWGPTILVLVIVGLCVLGLAYVTFDVETMGLSLGILLIGGLIWVALTYPIVITLERPVRITPEQALQDFYGALSHHLPHYRRMWLLLSDQGRTSAEFGSFDGFKTYWRRRLAELRSGGVSSSTPLVFVIEDFKSPKSAGETEIDAKYTIKVFARGRREQGPLATIRCESSLVRGPDRMWYLNQGTLPRTDA